MHTRERYSAEQEKKITVKRTRKKKMKRVQHGSARGSAPFFNNKKQEEKYSNLRCYIEQCRPNKALDSPSPYNNNKSMYKVSDCL